MVHSRELKKLQTSILEDKKNCDFKPFDIESSKIIPINEVVNQNSFIFDKIQSCKHFKINEDNRINLVNGSGNVKVTFENKSFLELIIGDNVNFLFLEIEVKENVSAEIYLKTTSKSLNLISILNLNKFSKLNIISHISMAKSMFKEINLKANSNFSIYENFLIKNSYTFLQNKIIHLEENSISNLDSKGCVEENGHVINDGIIHIKQKATNSSGYQNLKNIILDNTSKIFSEPILEIDNNLVSCSHGCTISDIDKETLHYMQTRGLSVQESRNLIVNSLFNSSLEYLDENNRKKLNLEI